MTWLLTAFIGASFGYALVQVIFLLSFYPKKPIRVGPFHWQGWIPRWLSRNLSTTLEKLVISIQVGRLIQERLLEDKTRQAADRWITDKVGDYLTHTLPVKWPMISMLIGEKTHDKVKQALSEYLLENWDKNVKSMGQEHLTDDAIRQHIRNIMLNTQSENWVDTIKKASFDWKLRIQLISLPLGAIMAILGKLLYQALLPL